MIFQHSHILWCLLAIPALLAAWIVMRRYRNRQLAQFADKSMFGRLLPDGSKSRPSIKFCLILTGMAFLIVALANPQVGSKMVKGERLGSDVAICLDISNSMMAEDIQPNRLERSKRVVANLLNELGSDRVSLVVFAGSSYIQMPLTSDYSAMKLFLDQVNCDLISAQGTAIGDAIEKAMESFGYNDPDREWEKAKSRAIVIISDGENHEDDAEEAARKAASEDIIVCTIGMGLPEGVPIPAYSHGQKTGYKQDRQGNTVTTMLNENMLAEIAAAGNGVYVRAGNINTGIHDIVKEIQHLEKANYGEAMFSEYESRYMYPLACGLFCLLLELFIFERKNRRMTLNKLLNKKAIIILFLMTSLCSWSQTNTSRKQIRQGNRHYNKERYDDAETDFRKAVQTDSTYYKAQYNLGNALYRKKDYAEAATHFQNVANDPKTSKSQKAKAFHNKGNAHLQAGLQDRANGMGQFQEAVKSYQEALKLDPKNDDTRHNLSYAKKLLQQAQQQQNGGGGDNNQDKDQKNDQQQQNGQGQQDKQNQQNDQQQNQQQNQQQQSQNGQQDKQQQQQQQQHRDQKKEDAERLLEAVRNNEKNTMKEHQKQIKIGQVGQIEKDW